MNTAAARLNFPRDACLSGQTYCHEAAGRRPPWRELREARAHPGGVLGGDQRRRGRTRVRRAAHRRRTSGLRARPRPPAYGERERTGLDDGARRSRPARVRVLEEPVGRLRRTSRSREGPHAAAAPRDRRRGRSTDRAGDRDQAPDAVRRAGRAASRGAARGVRVDRRRHPGPGDELLLRRAAADAEAGAPAAAGDADRQGPALAGAQARGRARLDPGPGHRRADQAPEVRGEDGRERSRRPRLDRQLPRSSSSCAARSASAR